jgi:hypothetical protein
MASEEVEDNHMKENHEFHRLLHLTEENNRLLRELLCALKPKTPTSISFSEITMNPTAAGQTQVFTGTLAPAGSAFAADTTFTIASNDPAVSPSVDSTGLIVSVTYPDGWVESTTTPLAFSYAAASASNPTWSLSATITPSAPPPPASTLPSSITFDQTT